VRIEAWIQASPNSQSAFVLRGRIHYESGRLALAKPALQQAVTLGAGSGPRLALARIAADQGQADEARRWLEEACRHAPADPQPALMLAELLTRHYGTPDEALVVLDRIIRKAPSAQVTAARDAVLQAQSAQGSPPQ
jgi:predicted Zn-dependent protease